jgi:prevent-host-death family protein
MARTIRKSGMKEVPLSEVKDDLSRYLREAETQEIVITRHGKPAGVLVGSLRAGRGVPTGGRRGKARQTVEKYAKGPLGGVTASTFPSADHLDLPVGQPVDATDHLQLVLLDRGAQDRGR